MEIIMNKFKYYILSFVIINSAMASDVLIYADDGAYEICINNTEESLRFELSDGYEIRRVYACELVNDEWLERTALLVFPGGIASRYAQKLNGKGNQNIRKFVEDGGNYLGFCGGAYYAGANVEFALGTNIEINRSHELAFFPGTIVGPILAPFDYQTQNGARIAEISWPQNAKIYYEGGGFFKSTESYENVKVISSYETIHKKPASVVHVEVQKGNVILSGVHFEYHSEELIRINNKIEVYKAEISRRQLLRYVLLLCRMSLKSIAFQACQGIF